jgi:hypothetical protein
MISTASFPFANKLGLPILKRSRIATTLLRSIGVWAIVRVRNDRVRVAVVRRRGSGRALSFRRFTMWYGKYRNYEYNQAYNCQQQ